MDIILRIAIVALLTGAVSFVIGLIARSVRLAIGCGITMLMAAGGCAAAWWIWTLVGG